jgi:hypothetical protein
MLENRGACSISHAKCPTNDNARRSTSGGRWRGCTIGRDMHILFYILYSMAYAEFFNLRSTAFAKQ